MQQSNSQGTTELFTRIKQHLLSAHETDLNVCDDNEYNSDITTEDNPTEHNFVNHEDIINFNTSADN